MVKRPRGGLMGILAGGAVALSGLLSVGCETNPNYSPGTKSEVSSSGWQPSSTELDIAASVLGGLAGIDSDPNEALLFDMTAGLFRNESKRTHERNLAGMNERIIVINNVPPEYFQQSPSFPAPVEEESQRSLVRLPSDMGWMVIGTCNYFKDFNGNGTIDWPKDYRSDNREGMKEVFGDEKITVVASFTNKLFGLRFALYDKNGEVVDERDFAKNYEALYSGSVVYNSGSSKRLESGEYLAEWFSASRSLGTWRFSVE